MVAGDELTPDDVKDLVAKNRVTKDVNYHAHQKGIRFDDIILALMGCYKVAKDTRTEHPNGWVAFCPQWGGALMRVDFNLFEDEDGRLLLVVTAMEMKK